MIRPFQLADESAVRQICFDTAYYGQSMQPYISDVEFISESLIAYYIRREPESLFVAEDHGQVVGYISGCLDSNHYAKVYTKEILPRLLKLFLHNGLWRRRTAWQMLSFSVRALPHWKTIHAQVGDPYPAHCHSNIRADHQGQGLGTQLMTALLAHLERRQCPGLHLTTATAAGKQFFSKMGFTVLLRHSMPMLFASQSCEVWLMGRRL